MVSVHRFMVQRSGLETRKNSVIFVVNIFPHIQSINLFTGYLIE